MSRLWSSVPTLAGVIWVSGENFIPPGSLPTVGQSLARWAPTRAPNTSPNTSTSRRSRLIDSSGPSQSATAKRVSAERPSRVLDTGPASASKVGRFIDFGGGRIA